MFPRVNSQPIMNELNMIPHSLKENIAPRYLRRINKGVVKKQYESYLQSNTIYPIKNYVSNYRLSKLYASTINKLSFISISSSL